MWNLNPKGAIRSLPLYCPELITYGDTISEWLSNAEDAFAVVLEIYEDEGVCCLRRSKWAAPKDRCP